jgi:L-threonylcarbamoyladenylate synthase
LRLVGALGQPITATSANRSGIPSSVTAVEVCEQFGDSLKFVIDGGKLPARGGSTLLDLTESPPRLLREGPIPESDLNSVLK